MREIGTMGSRMGKASILRQMDCREKASGRRESESSGICMRKGEMKAIWAPFDLEILIWILIS